MRDGSNGGTPTGSRRAIEVQELRKRYGDFWALKDASVTFWSGRVHALLGPNGSGKSTLIGCLGGGVRPDGGVIKVDGQVAVDLSPLRARDLGVAVIYQHFSLADSLSVSDNVFLGSELRRGVTINKREQRRRTQEIIAEFDLKLDADEMVGSLSPGQKQVVEIAKALLHKPRVLILDEPTTALSVAETEVLLQRVEALAASGLAIVFISHLLDDVMRLADDVTILRDGSVISSGPIDGLSKQDLIEAISPGHAPNGAPMTPRGKPILDLREAVVGGVGPLTLTVHEGEILGLFGLLGAGRTETLEGLFGAAPIEGAVHLDGVPYHPDSPVSAVRRGVALVPSDRARNGLFSHLSALDNVLMPSFIEGSRASILRRKTAERRIFQETSSRVSLRPANPRLEGGQFSGGNQQKLLISRWLNEWSGTGLLLLDEPTQGVDVGARGEIYQMIRHFAAVPGHAVIVAASEIEELAELVDRSAVLHRGRLAGVVERSSTFEQDLLTMAHTGERR